MATQQLTAFGVTLRQYREAAGLSQEDLAERAGLTVGAIGALERGERRRPYPHTLQLLSRALELNDADRAALIAAVPGRAKRALTLSTSTAQRPGAADFVGRRDELALLQARLADASAGRGGVVVLVGEAGIGKTRLARRLADDAQAQGATVLWGGCFEGNWQLPYAPWVEAIGQHATCRDPERLRRDLGPGASPIARVVPQVHSLFPELQLSSPLSADEERYRLYHAVTQLLVALASERTVLLVLDDLHWADTDSLRLLQHVARGVGRTRVLLLGIHRDLEPGLNDEHPLFATLSTLVREVEYQRLTLRGFSREEVGEYLAHIAGDALPQALVKAIEHETDGNPFYARERSSVISSRTPECSRAKDHGPPTSASASSIFPKAYAR
jgi:transcriptional regulator with XRE-family HTH domain